jgi:hypothetical protein
MSTKKNYTGPVFALAGQLVRTPQHARRIMFEAMKSKQDYLVLQARNVAILLARANAEAVSA